MKVNTWKENEQRLINVNCWLPWGVAYDRLKGRPYYNTVWLPPWGSIMIGLRLVKCFDDKHIYIYETVIVDVNECLKTTSVCDPRPSIGICTNVPGSYSCSCTSGYQLAANLKTCNGKYNCSRPNSSKFLAGDGPSSRTLQSYIWYRPNGSMFSKLQTFCLHCFVLKPYPLYHCIIKLICLNNIICVLLFCFHTNSSLSYS